MSDIGATSPARWQLPHFACRIGATSFVNVTAGAAALTGVTADRPCHAEAQSAKAGKSRPTARVRRRMALPLLKNGNLKIARKPEAPLIRPRSHDISIP